MVVWCWPRDRHERVDEPADGRDERRVWRCSHCCCWRWWAATARCEAVLRVSSAMAGLEGLRPVAAGCGSGGVGAVGSCSRGCAVAAGFGGTGAEPCTRFCSGSGPGPRWTSWLRFRASSDPVADRSAAPLRIDMSLPTVPWLSRSDEWVEDFMGRRGVRMDSSLLLPALPARCAGFPSFSFFPGFVPSCRLQLPFVTALATPRVG